MVVLGSRLSIVTVKVKSGQFFVTSYDLSVWQTKITLTPRHVGRWIQTSQDVQCPVVEVETTINFQLPDSRLES